MAYTQTMQMVIWVFVVFTCNKCCVQSRSITRASDFGTHADGPSYASDGDYALRDASAAYLGRSKLIRWRCTVIYAYHVRDGRKLNQAGFETSCVKKHAKYEKSFLHKIQQNTTNISINVYLTNNLDDNSVIISIILLLSNYC